MGGARNQVAVRLAIEGAAEARAEVKRTFDGIGDDGDRAATRLGKRFEQEMAAAERAIEKVNQTGGRIQAVTGSSPLQVASNAGDVAAMRAAAAAAADAEKETARYQQRAQQLLASMDPLYAAQTRFDGALANAKELLAAGAIEADQYARAEAVLRQELQQTTAAIEARKGVSASQTRFEQNVGLDRLSGEEKSAAASGAVYEEHFARLDERAQALLASMDPLYAAQLRFDRELANAKELLAAGAIETEQYAAKEQQLQAQLAQTTAAHQRLGGATGAQKAGMQQLGFQVQDLAVQVGGGTSFFRAFGQQLPQATGAMALMAGEGSKLGSILTGPIGIGIALATALLPPLIGKLFETAETVEDLTKKLRDNAAAADLQREAQERFDLGVNGQLEKLRKLVDANKDVGKSEEQRRAASIAELDTSARMSTNLSTLLRQRLDIQRQLEAAEAKNPSDIDVKGEHFSRAGPEVEALRRKLGELDGQLAKVDVSAEQLANGGLLRMLDRLAQLMPAARAAASALREVRYAADLTAEMAYMDEAQTPQGREAQSHRAVGLGIRTLGLGGAVPSILDQAESTRSHWATEALKPHHHRGGGRAAQNARNAESMEENTQQTLLLADAYLESANAATIAEARRKAFTDGARRGIDQEAQYQRQLALTVATEVANSAKAVRTMEDETATRTSVLTRIESLTGGYRGLQRETDKELALAPLRRLQALAVGDAQERITRIIERQTTAINDRNAAQDRTAAELAVGQAGSAALDAEHMLAFAGRDRATVEDERIRRQVLAQALDGNWTDPERETVEEKRLREARANRAAETISGLTQETTARTQSIAMLQAELGMLGLGTRERERQLRLLQYHFDLMQRFPEATEAQRAALERSFQDEDKYREQLERTRAAMQELQQVGDRLIDDVLDPDNWSDWGSMGEKVLKDLEKDLLRLALINPFKNWLLGENNQTLGGILGGKGGGLGGLLSSLFGHGSSAFGSTPSAFTTLDTSGFNLVSDFDPWDAANFALPEALPTGFATGTKSFPGGWAMMNELGPEMVKLPGGSEIVPAAETRRRMGANDNASGGVTQHFDLRGAVVTEDLYQKMLAIGEQAAARGAAGGAVLSAAETQAASTRKLGRRW